MAPPVAPVEVELICSKVPVVKVLFAPLSIASILPPVIEVDVKYMPVPDVSPVELKTKLELEPLLVVLAPVWVCEALAPETKVIADAAVLLPILVVPPEGLIFNGAPLRENVPDEVI